MPVQLNHTIVQARDKRESASFLAEMLGVVPPPGDQHPPGRRLTCLPTPRYLGDTGEVSGPSDRLTPRPS